MVRVVCKGSVASGSRGVIVCLGLLERLGASPPAGPQNIDDAPHLGLGVQWR